MGPGRTGWRLGLAKPREALRFTVMERVAPETSLGRILAWCRTVQATDLHAQADHLYTYRLDGHLLRIPAAQFAAPTNDDIMRILREGFSASICDRIEKQHEMDLSFICGEVRYRAVFTKQQGKQSCSCRVVRQHHNRLDDLELPATLGDLVKEPRGLLLIAGGSGQGRAPRRAACFRNSMRPSRCG